MSTRDPRRTLATLAALLASTAALTSAPTLARADDAEAMKLFQHGRDLMSAGKIVEACDAFAASDARDSKVGTLLNLGECREENQQIATAWSVFLRAAALAQRLGPSEHERADEARRRAGYLQPRLSYLTVSVAASSEIPGLVITRDGTPIDPAYWNQGVPVDGGTYVIAAQVPGQDPWRTTVIVPPENGHVVAEVPRLKSVEELTAAVDLRPPPHPPAAPPPAPGADVESSAAAGAEHPARTPRVTHLRVGALVLGAGGLAAFGGAGWLALASRRDARDAWALCPSEPCHDPMAATLGDRAHDRSLYADLAFAGGAVAVAGAVTLWIVGRPHHHASAHDHAIHLVPQAAPDHVGVALHLEL